MSQTDSAIHHCFNTFFKDQKLGGVEVTFNQVEKEWKKVEKLCASPKNPLSLYSEFLEKNAALKQKQKNQNIWIGMTIGVHFLKLGAYLTVFGVCASQLYLRRRAFSFPSLKTLPQSLWQNQLLFLSIAASLLSTGLQWLYFEGRAENAIRDYSEAFKKNIKERHQNILKDKSLRQLPIDTRISPEIQGKPLGTSLPEWTKKKGYAFVRIEWPRNPLLLIREYNIEALLKGGIVSKLEVVAANLLWSAYQERIKKFVKENPSEAPETTKIDGHLIYSVKASIMHEKQSEKLSSVSGKDNWQEKLMKGFLFQQYIQDPLHQIFEQIIRYEQKRRLESVGAALIIEKKDNVALYSHFLFGNVHFSYSK